MHCRRGHQQLKQAQQHSKCSGSRYVEAAVLKRQLANVKPAIAQSQQQVAQDMATFPSHAGEVLMAASAEV
ncbi:hypothetical protein WJX74_004106 [Apatococcus lobatus]|uniref:Uncharacterized protein n=1 Tax=Apatococcus lobatus TaxID=904363 RepID=A0AAW1RPD2_9CHLO